MQGSGRRIGLLLMPERCSAARMVHRPVINERVNAPIIKWTILKSDLDSTLTGRRNIGRNRVNPIFGMVGQKEAKISVTDDEVYSWGKQNINAPINGQAKPLTSEWFGSLLRQLWCTGQAMAASAAGSPKNPGMKHLQTSRHMQAGCGGP